MSNPRLDLLQPYPFERLRALFAQVSPKAGLSNINLSIGEPKHPTPAVLTEALNAAHSGLATYPTTLGLPELRQSIASWIGRRYGITVNSETEVLPVLGSREALFSFAQVVLDPADRQALVVSPNPFYQIYEGAALLGGATPHYLPIDASGQCDYTAVPDSIWASTKLVYVCSPGNPTGAVLPQSQWNALFAASDRFGFVIASDECYSEIYLDEAHPPLGALNAAVANGRPDFRNLVVFSSLSKRSNAPGLRSGFVAGDAHHLKLFLKYRTYHGSAMSPTVQGASIAAWDDDKHVRENRSQYINKFNMMLPILKTRYEVEMPQAGFYLWMKTPDCDQLFCKTALQEANVTLLPGSFLARTVNGENPGAGRVRIALVAPLQECEDAAKRLINL
jgi:N-succinyldiaminopimelate aminotransferase